MIRATIEREYLTTAEVAEIFRTSAETVRYWRHIGKGPRSLKPGKRVLYAVEDVEAYQAELRGDAQAIQRGRNAPAGGGRYAA